MLPATGDRDREARKHEQGLHPAAYGISPRDFRGFVARWNMITNPLTLDHGPRARMAQEMNMRSYTVGALASAASIGRDTIRHYERTGLLPPPGRTASGYRLYSEIDLERVQFIRKAKRLGFTLQEIGQLLSLRSSTSARTADVLRVTQNKINQAEARIAELIAIKNALEQVAADCPVDAPASDCPILAYISNTSRP